MPSHSFKPIQPYFVLNTHSSYFKRNVDLNGIVHIYSFKMDQAFQYQFAVPDGCVDIVFCISEEFPEVFVYGSTQKPAQTSFRAGCKYFGVRYQLGATPICLEMPPGQLVDQCIPLADKYKKTPSLLEQIIYANNFAERLDIILQTKELLSDNKIPAVCYNLCQQMIRYGGNIRVSELTELTHYSIRSINSYFFQYFGLTPKTFCLIVRNQKALQDLTKNQYSSLTDLALDLGYADQSHFLSEFKRYNVISPKKFMNAVNSHQYQDHIVFG